MTAAEGGWTADRSGRWRLRTGFKGCSGRTSNGLDRGWTLGGNFPVLAAKWLAWLIVIMIIAVGVLACRSASGTPTPRPTLQPTSTLVPLPTSTPVPLPTPALAVDDCDGDGDCGRLEAGVRVTAAAWLDDCDDDGYCGRLEAGVQVMAAAWLDDDRMYLAGWDGSIRLLNVETGDVVTALEGLTYPRGLTVLDGRLYVTDMGNVCQLIQELSEDDDYTGCKRWPKDSEAEYFSRVNAQILSYAIGDSGKLTDRQIIVDRLMARDIEHSPNGMTNDGEYVYASIGHMTWNPTEHRRFVKIYDELGENRPRTDLTGVIVRFRPPDNEVEVYASGFRNTYGISVASDGTIYGADNDTVDGISDDSTSEENLEELNAIVKGGFYGYPEYGTNTAPPEANVIEPVAVLQGKASTYAYPSEDGVYVAYVAIGGDDDGFVVDRFGYGVWTPERVFIALNYTTAILERDGLLYIVSLNGNIHVINPAAPLLVYARRMVGPFHNNAYVDGVVAQGTVSEVRTGGPGYDVYVDGKRVIYVKSDCGQKDREDRFYLHVNPVNPNDLPEERQQHGFDNLDFQFNSEYGWRSGDRCLAVRELPDYAISSISTGQFVLEGTDFIHSWDAAYSFDDGG